jgi:Protein of unknown function (DUF2380)
MLMLRSVLAAALCASLLPLDRPEPPPRIAVLEFDIADYTPTPNTPGEIAEARDAGGELRHSLATKCGYDIVPVNTGAQRAAAGNAARYLFQHPAEAAKLGKAAGAAWVVMGELAVASPIVSEFHVELIRAESGELAGAVAIEMKGDPSDQGPVFSKAIDQVARQLDRQLAQPGRAEASPRCPAIS